MSCVCCARCVGCKYLRQTGSHLPHMAMKLPMVCTTLGCCAQVRAPATLDATLKDSKRGKPVRSWRHARGSTLPRPSPRCGAEGIHRGTQQPPWPVPAPKALQVGRAHRKTMREPSVNTMRRPWPLATLPSMGSLYSKSSAKSTSKPAILSPFFAPSTTPRTSLMTCRGGVIQAG
jgi:hypothetical protein